MVGDEADKRRMATFAGRRIMLAAGLLAASTAGAAAQEQLPGDWRALLSCLGRSSYINAIDFDLNLGEGTLTPRAGVDRVAFVKAHAGCVRQLPKAGAPPAAPAATKAAGGKAGGGQAKAERAKDIE